MVIAICESLNQVEVECGEALEHVAIDVRHDANPH